MCLAHLVRRVDFRLQVSGRKPFRSGSTRYTAIRQSSYGTCHPSRRQGCKGHAPEPPPAESGAAG